MSTRTLSLLLVLAGWVLAVTGVLLLAGAGWALLAAGVTLAAAGLFVVDVRVGRT